MKSLETLRQEAQLKKESQIRRDEAIRRRALIEGALRKRVEEEKAKSSEFLHESDFFALSLELSNLNFNLNMPEVSVSRGKHVVLDKRHDKSRNGYHEGTLVTIPHIPSETSDYIILYWDSKNILNQTGKSGFIIEARLNGDILLIGRHERRISHQDWNGNRNLQEEAFNQAYQNPFKLIKTSYRDVGHGSSYTEGPGG